MNHQAEISAPNCLIEGQNKLVNSYQYEFTPYLKESNAYGNIYFTHHFEWQGICRERWFSSCVIKDMFSMDGVFVTKFAHCDFETEAYPFRRILCLLNTRSVKKFTFHLVFRFYDVDSRRLLSRGEQKLAYLSPKDKTPIKLPNEVIEKIKGYEA